MAAKIESASQSPSEDWSAYAEYNKVLRAWFVAFGIGVPSTFLINNGLSKYISPNTGDPSLMVIFLVGAGAQVLMAFVNKTINWCAYYAEKKNKSGEINGCGYKIASVLSKMSYWFWIDFFFDLITIVCFSYAIYNLFVLIIASPTPSP